MKSNKILVQCVTIEAGNEVVIKRNRLLPAKNKARYIMAWAKKFNTSKENIYLTFKEL